ncbi:DUF6252 family protein [Flavobacterium reichenbachii]|uniref:Lipoprotein n=1 Tax=Flavobacterium reichenbachii TaxID=362418 RepID=A0A085ZRN7_9FLAO|nr:DUF6252 family protein [Flavobacterium reichenbachii]KFF07101.1 hypothetical protein IW19_16970 [Flavobacterium reichenbachii]OXB13404.1 hypothetical protein B0A68_16785 [Flavobacterium reichenbachii]
MTKIKPVLFLLLSTFIFSCSSETETETPKVEYTLSYDDKPLIISDLEATRDGDFFSIHQIDFAQNLSLPASAPTFYFHKDGTLLGASIQDYKTKEILSSPFYFSKDHFAFQIEKLDEANKTVSIKFNGNVYEHYWDQIYQFNKKLSGTISIPYTEKNPINSKKTYGTTMKVNGQNWRGSGYIWTHVFSEKSHILKISGDNEYSITIVFPKGSLKIGKYSFTKNSDIYKDYTVTLFKYAKNNIGPDDYFIGPKEFVTTGELEITDIKGGSYIAGTFSLKAVNPETNENVTVSDGVFKENRDLD